MALVGGLAACSSAESPFDWEVSPKTATIQPGESATYRILIRSKANIDDRVFASASGLPEGAAAALHPAVLPGTADHGVITIQTTAGIVPGSYDVTVAVREEGKEKQTDTVSFVVTRSRGEPDFALSVDPAEFTYGEIDAKTFAYRVVPLGGFHGSVDIAVTGVPDDYRLVQEPTPVVVGEGGFGSAGATFVLRYEPNGAVDGRTALTVTATGAGVTHERTIRVHPPSGTVAPGAPSQHS